MIKAGIKSITIEDIYSRTDDFELLQRYLGINTLPTLINSPLRKDESPSFGLYLTKSNRVNWRDFATGEKGSFIDLLEKYWGLSFVDTINRIYRELPDISSPDKIKIKKSKKVSNHQNKANISCVTRNWRKHDIEYWKEYGISLKWLKWADIYPISIIIVTKNTTYKFPAEKYAYVYVERKDDVTTLKVYQPYSKKYKWSNNNSSSVWNLWSKLPSTGEKLIIASSRKDSLCIWENTGIPSISLQAESYLPKKKIIDELKNRFTSIYILYDNDFQSNENHGHIFGNRISRAFNIPQIEIPTLYQSKDPSDLFKNYGKEVFIKVIKELINELE